MRKKTCHLLAYRLSRWDSMKTEQKIIYYYFSSKYSIVLLHGGGDERKNKRKKYFGIPQEVLAEQKKNSWKITVRAKRTPHQSIYQQSQNDDHHTTVCAAPVPESLTTTLDYIKLGTHITFNVGIYARASAMNSWFSLIQVVYILRRIITSPQVHLWVCD